MAGRAFDLRGRMNAGSKHEVDQRAALFGSRYQGSRDREERRPLGAAAMEEQNDQHIEDLEAKVGTLREISLGISSAVRESNSLLGGMGEGMDKASRLVKGTLSQVVVMIERNGGVGMCKIILSILVVLIFIWLFLGSSKKKL